MDTLYWVLLALILGSVGSVALASLMLLLKKKQLEILSQHLLYVAGGTLLGAVFMGMLPKSLSMLDAPTVLMTTLVGILLFFLLEKIILWRKCRNTQCDRQLTAAAPIVLIGDAFHNAIDGIIIAAGFLTSNEMGIMVTVSVVLHEIPQELADFGILLKSGYSKRKALGYNLLSGATAIVTGVAAYFMLDQMQEGIPYALALSASSFLYIALADLIPEMHRKTSLRASLTQFVLILLGMYLIFINVHH
ncbi:MAG TPA: ZIP family metal transporter [Bacteroidales bacterium]|nr:ZIP family metal transporter [Bacteroidales bacterium]